MHLNTIQYELLGTKPDSTRKNEWITALREICGQENKSPDVQIYSGSVYQDYPGLGLSLEYKDLGQEMILDSIHIFNRSTNVSKDNKCATFAKYPVMNIDGREESFTIGPGTTAKEFVQTLGEPNRKGGGLGPLSGSIGIWCEWTNIGVMIEFGGVEAHGWDTGSDAIWKELTVFKP